MSSRSYISISQKPIFLKPLLKSPGSSIFKLLLPKLNRVSRCFIPLLAFWALLYISQVLLPPLACPPYLHHPRLSSRQPPADEFWKWALLSNETKAEPCLNFSEPYLRAPVGTSSSGKYMMVVVSGGLNQQRHQIIDAVVVARIVGAVLVVPVFQVNQVWGDESEFGDIFDVDHFKRTLEDHVAVVSSLPASHIGKKLINAPGMRFQADEQWIRKHYGKKLSNNTILLLSAFDSRLAKELNADLQKLRCKVAFEALIFQPRIQKIADLLIKRMEEEGSYLALHLRLEKDVWVRTGCHSGLGKEANMMIENERARKPQFLTSRTNLSAEERYHAGLCPLNAVEISRLLQGLGASRYTRIYYAGGEPFGGQKMLKPLRKQFPNFFNKWNLARPGQLDGIRNKPSILAAIDYLVCLKSQVFLANHGGNMARALQGHRIFLSYGKQIKPNKRLLVQLFSNKSLSDAEIKQTIKQVHTEPLNLTVVNSKAMTDVVAFPTFYCMCSKNSDKIDLTRR